jgi:hypothetical protein
MRETRITLPELALIAGTRAAIGGGVGLLSADRLSDEQRKAIGWTLLLVGAFVSIPIAFEILGRQHLSSDEEWEPAEGGHWSGASERPSWRSAPTPY